MRTLIYLFDQDGAFLGAGRASPPPAPGEGEIFPWNSTTTTPPQYGANQVPVWNGASWSVKPDFRGETYWLMDGSKHEITKVGETIPSNALAGPPDQPEPEPSGAYVRRAQFAVAASQPPFQLISDLDAEDWAAGASLPSAVANAINASPDMTDAEKLAARITARTRGYIAPDHPLVTLAQAAFGMTNAEKAALFDAAAKVKA